MEITYLGHSGFKIKSGASVLVDPWLTGNPTAAFAADEINGIDVLLVTHGHPDHVGDSQSIARRTGAVFVSVVELAGSDEVQGIGMNYGGTVTVSELPITMVKAEHSVGGGDSAGFIWKQGGKTLYHMGDTSLFSDLKLIGELYRPDIVFMPIGGHYTMGPDHAALAVEWLAPEIVIPMHYATFPILEPNADRFAAEVALRCKTKTVVLTPGQTFDI